PSTSAAPVLTVGHNAKKRKTSHSNWIGKAAKGKSDHGSMRKAESKIAPTSDPNEAVCFYCNSMGHWKSRCPKYLKDLKDGKVEKGSHSIKLHNPTTSDLWVLYTGCAFPYKGIYEIVGCISHNGIVILNVDGVLESFNFKSDDVCESFLLGKMTKSPFMGSCERGEGLLDLVHTDVCGPFRSATKDGKHYYITFTDDFSRYGYVYLFKHKSDTFEVFKRYQNKLTPPGIPQLNRVAERRNKTLLDMVRSMMSRATLLISFLGYALETAAHILNLVPTKKVSKTPFKMWKGKRPSLGHIKI
ncbi:retrotransposon protein, putative, ty1-copia subclass, partial [Tanacetum coccineum]